MAFDIKEYAYGLADVTFTRNSQAVTLPAQADAAVLTVEPVTIAIENYELGTLDEILDRYNVTLEMTFDSREAMFLGLPLAKTTGSGADAGKVNYKDVAAGTSLRSLLGGEIKIHPRNAGSDVDYDMVIFKAVPTGSEQITFGKEKSVIKITFKALVKDDAVAGEEGNYFQIGPDIHN